MGDRRPGSWFAQSARYRAALILAVVLGSGFAGITVPAWARAAFDYLAAPPEGKAKVLIFRPPRFFRSDWAQIYVDDQILARFGYGAYYEHVVEPGSYRYMVVSEAADFLDVEAEAGHIYFVEIVPRTGFWRSRFSLVGYPPNHPRLKKLHSWLRQSNPVQPGDTERAWHDAHGRSVAQKRDAYLAKWLTRDDVEPLRSGHPVSFGAAPVETHP